MSYASDLTDEQCALLEPVFHAPGKRGPKHGPVVRFPDPGVVPVPAVIAQVACIATILRRLSALMQEPGRVPLAA